MHYFAAVVVPKDADVEKAVTEAMAPFDENDGDNPAGEWDWWVIGGRWTGVWSEYDPVRDPANLELCRLCAGTGMRNDARGQAYRAEHPDYTCNGCVMAGSPPGQTVKHPSEWQPHEFDQLPSAKVLRLTEASSGFPQPYTLVTDGGWWSRENWDGTAFTADPDFDRRYISALREHAETHLVVVVDYHC